MHEYYLLLHNERKHPEYNDEVGLLDSFHVVYRLLGQIQNDFRWSYGEAFGLSESEHTAKSCSVSSSLLHPREQLENVDAVFPSR